MAHAIHNSAVNGFDLTLRGHDRHAIFPTPDDLFEKPVLFDLVPGLLRDDLHRMRRSNHANRHAHGGRTQHQ